MHHQTFRVVWNVCPSWIPGCSACATATATCFRRPFLPNCTDESCWNGAMPSELSAALAASILSMWRPTSSSASSLDKQFDSQQGNAMSVKATASDETEFAGVGVSSTTFGPKSISFHECPSDPRSNRPAKLRQSVSLSVLTSAPLQISFPIKSFSPRT